MVLLQLCQAVLLWKNDPVSQAPLQLVEKAYLPFTLMGSVIRHDYGM